jgi:hypothetical protein
VLGLPSGWEILVIGFVTSAPSRAMLAKSDHGDGIVKN